MFAIVDYNGVQIKLTVGKESLIPFANLPDGDKIVFEKVLMASDDQETKIGEPYLDGAKVEATVLNAVNGKKVSVVKFHSKKRYQKIGSHRQDYTKILVDKINK